MAEINFSRDSNPEEVAEFFSKNFKLDEKEKSIILNEGISGNVLLDISSFEKVFDFRFGVSNKIKKYLDKNKDKFVPKEITEKISIQTEEEIQSFFEKYIGIKGQINNIKGENELKNLKEEDMKKLGLNFGQRIILARYIKYFISLKSKEIEITITKDSDDDETSNYLKSELNISQQTIDNLFLDAEALFDLTEENLIDFLNKNKIQQEEFETLKEFIKKRDEMKKQDNITIDKNISYEDFIKFIKERLNFDIEKEDINELNNLDKYENLTKDEKEIIKNFINKRINENRIINKDNNIINDDNDKDDKFEDFQKMRLSSSKTFEFKRKSKIKNQESDEIQYSKKEKVDFQNNANYNIFFVLSTIKESYQNLGFSFFTKQLYGLNCSYIHYHSNLINVSTYYINKDNKIRKYFLLLFQVFSDSTIDNLSINIIDFEGNNEIFEPIYESQKISIKEGEDNFFILEDYQSTYNFFPKISINDFFSEYLNYFFDDKITIKNTIKKSLIESLSAKITNTKKIKLSPKNILKFIKYCGKQSINPTNFENIIIDEKEELDKQYYLSNDFIKNNFSNKAKEMIFSIFLKIYLIYDIEYLLEMLNMDNFSEIFLLIYSIQNKQIFKTIEKKMNGNQIKRFQNSLIKCANSSEKIQIIIDFGRGIENTLNLIFENLFIIISKLDEENKPFKGFNLNNPEEKDDIQQIFIIFNKINDAVKQSKKEYNLVKIEDIFEKMVDTYIKKNLNDYLLLKNFIKKGNINSNILDKYYTNIHVKGMTLIINNKMTPKEIINFITTQDYYYYNDKWSTNPNRDPEIFNYINISSNYENYKENILLIKENYLFKLYDKSTQEMKERFYSILLNQINTLNDMKNIFNIFPSEYIRGRFLDLINDKIKNLLKLINQNDDNQTYDIIDNWLFFNYKDEICGKLEEVTESLKDLIQFTPNYYVNLLKKKDMNLIVKKITNSIISFFIEQGNGNNEILADEKALFSLLKDSPNDDFFIIFFKSIDKKIFKESDFYTKEMTKNFKFFKLFLENCNDVILEKLSECSYIIESTKTHTKIIDDLKNKTIKYGILVNLISDDNIFFEKIKVLLKEETDIIFNDLKDSLNLCKKQYAQLELISDYYNQFYKETKKAQLILIKKN